MGCPSWASLEAPARRRAAEAALARQPPAPMPKTPAEGYFAAPCPAPRPEAGAPRPRTWVGRDQWHPSQRHKASDPSMGAVVEAATEFEFQILGRPRATGRRETTPNVTRAGDVCTPFSSRHCLRGPDDEGPIPSWAGQRICPTMIGGACLKVWFHLGSNCGSGAPSSLSSSSPWRPRRSRHGCEPELPWLPLAAQHQRPRLGGSRTRSEERRRG